MFPLISINPEKLPQGSCFIDFKFFGFYFSLRTADVFLYFVGLKTPLRKRILVTPAKKNRFLHKNRYRTPPPQKKRQQFENTKQIPNKCPSFTKTYQQKTYCTGNTKKKGNQKLTKTYQRLTLQKLTNKKETKKEALEMRIRLLPYRGLDPRGVGTSFPRSHQGPGHKAVLGEFS